MASKRMETRWNLLPDLGTGSLLLPPRLHTVYFVQPQPAETMNISSLKQVHDWPALHVNLQFVHKQFPRRVDDWARKAHSAVPTSVAPLWTVA